MKMVSTFDLCDECIKNLISDLKTINASVEVSDCEQDYDFDDLGCACKKIHSVTVTIDEPLGKVESYEVYYDGRYDGCVEFGDFRWRTETEHFYIFGGSEAQSCLLGGFTFGDLAIYRKNSIGKVVITNEKGFLYS